MKTRTEQINGALEVRALLAKNDVDGALVQHVRNLGLDPTPERLQMMTRMLLASRLQDAAKLTLSGLGWSQAN